MSEASYLDMSAGKGLPRGISLLRMATVFGLTASAVSLADNLIGRQIWPSAPTRLVGMQPETREAAMTFGGLGSTNTAHQSEYGKLVLPGDAVYWDYSTDRVSIKDMARLFHDASKSLRRIHINGHSMGGPLGMEVVRRANNTDLKLGHVILHCSPYKASDAKLNTIGKGLKICRWPAGPMNKGIVSFVRHMMEDGGSVLESVDCAKEDAANGCSPRQWRSMELLRQGLNLSKHLPEYAPLVDSQTRFSYCMPENPRDDKTIHVERACKNWLEDLVVPLRELSGHDIPFDVYRVPNAGHAEVQKDCEYMAEQPMAQN